MIHSSIFPAKYVQGADAIDELAGLTAHLGKNALLIGDIIGAKNHLLRIRNSFEAANLGLVVEEFRGECCDQEIDRLQTCVRDHRCDVVIGLGGGKAMDTGKSVGHGMSTRVVTVPTIASTDAATSSLAVIYTAEGAFDRYQFFKKNPDLVLVDTAIIAKAPVRFLIAGIGDALSTWFEADTCRQSYSNNIAGGIGTLAAYSLARLCYDTIVEFGVSACRSCEAGVVTPALEHVVGPTRSSVGSVSRALVSPARIPSITDLPCSRKHTATTMEKRWQLECKPGSFWVTNRKPSSTRFTVFVNRWVCRPLWLRLV